VPGLTVFAYGQTGAGKTYTMEPIYRDTIRETLHAAPAAGLAVSIRFFEIYCAKVFDLLNNRAEVKTMEDAEGDVQVVGAREEEVWELQHALDTVELGKACRVTHGNAVHDASSRSHAILQLVVRAPCDGFDEVTIGPEVGKIVLVDLAGSERASETLSDDKATRIEGAEINKVPRDAHHA
jgi:kinesin family protein 2/24